MAPASLFEHAQQLASGCFRKSGIIDVQIQLDQLDLRADPIPKALEEDGVGFRPPEWLPLGVDR